MAYQGFIEKVFTKNATKEDFTLLFYPIVLGLCKFYSKLLNLDPIFDSDVHLSIANNFSN
jgi:hypothetical protein